MEVDSKQDVYNHDHTFKHPWLDIYLSPDTKSYNVRDDVTFSRAKQIVFKFRHSNRFEETFYANNNVHLPTADQLWIKFVGFQIHGKYAWVKMYDDFHEWMNYQNSNLRSDDIIQYYKSIRKNWRRFETFWRKSYKKINMIHVQSRLYSIQPKKLSPIEAKRRLLLTRHGSQQITSKSRRNMEAIGGEIMKIVGTK